MPERGSPECALCQRREWFAEARREYTGWMGVDYAMIGREHWLEGHQADVCSECRTSFTRLGDPRSKWSRLCFGCLSGKEGYDKRDLS
jgi:hypothetical protein